MDNTNLFTSSSDGSFQVNTNFANERLTNLRVNQAQEGFDKEMEAREMAAINQALTEAKPALPAPHNKDPKTMTQEERHAALQIIDQRMQSAGIENRLRGDSDRNPILGEITDGLRNIGQAFGVGNRVSGESGMVDANGNFHPRTCFTKGTLVTKLKAKYYEEARNGDLSPDKHYEEKVAIETIKAGDYVLSFDEVKKAKSYKKVTELFYHEVELLYVLELASGEMIETTWNHPFYVVREEANKRSTSLTGGWVEAKDLKAGDKLLNASGNIIQLKSSSQQIQEESISVYNFEVEDNHTYYVGDNGVLVHNYLPTPGDGPFQVAQKTGLTMAELEKLNPGILHNGTFVGKDIKLEPSVTEESQTDTKYGAKANESLQDVVNRYNRENGTNYSLTDIQVSNPLINNIDSRGNLLPLPISTAVHFPERSALDKMGNFFTSQADGLRNFGSTFANRFTGALDGYASLVNSTKKNFENSTSDFAKFGNGLFYAATTIIGAPIAYGLHVAGSAVAMAAGTLLQPMSPVDYTWGVGGTAVGLGVGMVNILAGKPPNIKNGVVQFQNALGMGSGAGISFGPINFGKTFNKYQVKPDGSIKLNSKGEPIKNKSFKPDNPDYPFGHEYGHTIQNRALGPLYYPAVAIPSVVSTIVEWVKEDEYGRRTYQHDEFTTETSATYTGTEEYYRRENARDKEIK